MQTFRAFLDKADERLGDGLEHLLCAHHRRRLRGLGWGDVLESGGVRDRLGGRAGNHVEVLVDGEESLAAIAAAIRRAQSHVHIANWHASAGASTGPTAWCCSRACRAGPAGCRAPCGDFWSTVEDRD